MSIGTHRPEAQAGGFRLRLTVAMMLVVAGATVLVLYFTERHLAAGAEQVLRQKFLGELAALRNVRALREAALLERCRALVRKPRIHAALEDGALDLLYLSARDEMGDVMAGAQPAGGRDDLYALHAGFYRFLGPDGAVIPPGRDAGAGELRAAEELALRLPTLPDRPQFGYLPREPRAGDAAAEVDEIIAMPVVSSETGETIAMLVLGFRPVPKLEAWETPAAVRGLWLQGRWLPAGDTRLDQPGLAEAVAGAIARGHGGEGATTVQAGGRDFQLFFQQLNQDSGYPAAVEVCLYPLDDLRAQQSRLRLQVAGLGLLVLLAGLGASHFLSARLSRPVERLAVDSAENRVQRERAEAALETRSAELQRAARFSADASHQLKTPIAVMRAGLEELQARPEAGPVMQRELAALVRQTYRLSGVIDDLLLLSRMDAGRLKLKFGPVDLSWLIAAALDDLDAQNHDRRLVVDADCPGGLVVLGDAHYAGLILQNLLENARKYNVPAGRIQLVARRDGPAVTVRVGNTGREIPPEMQAHIFERFHRGAMGEDIPGYGLGLNLSRELARLHQGELRLVASAAGWTEFEVRFRWFEAASEGRVEE